MKKYILFAMTMVVLLPLKAQQIILMAPDETAVLVDDIDQITFEANPDGTSGEDTDVLIMRMKDGSIHRGICGKTAGAGVFLFNYVPKIIWETCQTEHQNGYVAEWHVAYVGKKDGNYSVGLWWTNNDLLLRGFQNLQHGICISTSPQPTIENSDHVMYDFKDEMELRLLGSDYQYLFIGSQLDTPIFMHNNSFTDDGDDANWNRLLIGDDNWLKIPLEYGKTYYYRPFTKGDMMQHGEMKTLTFYDEVNSFRVPRVMEDAGFAHPCKPTVEACNEIAAHFPDSVTAPTWSELENLWYEWLRCDESAQQMVSANCTSYEFDDGTAYDLRHIPDEFFTWMMHKEIVVDVCDTTIWTVSSAKDPKIVNCDDVPGGRYIRVEPLNAGTNPTARCHCTDVVPGVNYKLQVTFAPETEDEDVRPSKLRIAISSLEDDSSSFANGEILFNQEIISATEVVTLEAENVNTSAMGMTLKIQSFVTSKERLDYNRVLRIADIRLIPEP